MLNFKVEVNIKGFTQNAAELKAKQLEEIGKNLDDEAIHILAEKSKKPGMSKKLKTYKHMI